jgi:hypothetical protein
MEEESHRGRAVCGFTAQDEGETQKGIVIHSVIESFEVLHHFVFAMHEDRRHLE